MKLIAWLALSLAVLANVVANISLKFAVRQASYDSSGHFLVRFFMQTWTWIGLCAGVILLASYLLAIRDIGLGFSYAIVTSVALVLVTISAAIAFQERMSLTTVIGIGLIMVGIAVLGLAQIQN
jgi:small multidrug resistance pump